VRRPHHASRPLIDRARQPERDAEHVRPGPPQVSKQRLEAGDDITERRLGAADWPLDLAPRKQPAGEVGNADGEALGPDLGAEQHTRRGVEGELRGRATAGRRAVTALEHQQGAAYEGLTCDSLELAYAAGGEILSPDGKKAVIDSPQNLQALQLMVDGVKNGTAVNGVTTYMEEESRR
jgi:hypothetical protein